MWTTINNRMVLSLKCLANKPNSSLIDNQNSKRWFNYRNKLFSHNEFEFNLPMDLSMNTLPVVLVREMIFERQTSPDWLLTNWLNSTRCPLINMKNLILSFSHENLSKFSMNTQMNDQVWEKQNLLSTISDEFFIVDLDLYLSDIDLIENSILDDLISNPKLGEDLVLCHNDLLVKNIIYHEKSNQISFIDFEYTHLNYALLILPIISLNTLVLMMPISVFIQRLKNKKIGYKFIIKKEKYFHRLSMINFVTKFVDFHLWLI